MKFEVHQITLFNQAINFIQLKIRLGKTIVKESLISLN